MVAVAAKGLGTGEGWFERGQGAHLPARRASKDPPTVTSVGERQRRARAGAAFLAGRRRDMARNDLKLGGITPWLFSQCAKSRKGNQKGQSKRTPPEKWTHPDNRPGLLTELQNLF